MNECKPVTPVMRYSERRRRTDRQADRQTDRTTTG